MVVVLILLRCASFVKGAKHCRMKVFFEAMKVSVLKNTSSLASLANNGLEFHHLKEVQNTAKRLTGYQVRTLCQICQINE